MATARLPMRKACEILRQKLLCGLSHRQVARSVGVSPSSVADVVSRAQRAQLDWALSPGRVALLRVSLGQGPSVHHLRCRSLGVVRLLHRYYAPVRLLMFVRHRRSPLGLPTRPTTFGVAGEREISRLPCEILRHAFAVFGL